jgi:hypothetical protein
MARAAGRQARLELAMNPSGRRIAAKWVKIISIVGIDHRHVPLELRRLSHRFWSI